MPRLSLGTYKSNFKPVVLNVLVFVRSQPFVHRETDRQTDRHTHTGENIISAYVYSGTLSFPFLSTDFAFLAGHMLLAGPMSMTASALIVLR